MKLQLQRLLLAFAARLTMLAAWIGEPEEPGAALAGIAKTTAIGFEAQRTAFISRRVSTTRGSMSVARGEVQNRMILREIENFILCLE